MVTLSQFLEPDAVMLNMAATCAEDVIRALGSVLCERGYVKDNFVEATLAREAKTPTGIPLAGEVNAALPHVEPEYVDRPALALATLKGPVTFRNMVTPDEEVPVRLVIMLALNEGQSHIEMLRQVALLLQRPEIIGKIVAATTPDEVFEILNELGELE
jgi:PTS system galactitol-specific IIA component